MSSRRNLHITPSNYTADGKISYRSGNPVLQFIIGEADMMLMGKSIRLNGRFKVAAKEGANSVPVNASNIRMSEQLGMWSIIDQLVIKSQATHQVIEEIKSYQRFMGSYLPVTSSIQDNMGHLNETALVAPNYQLHKMTVVDALNGSNSVSGAFDGNSFSIHLPCGLFNGQVPIPLQPNGAGGLGGILLEIHLSPDSNVLFGQDGTTTEMLNAFYQLEDVYLSAEAMVPDPTQKLPPANTFEFNSISSYFTTFNSANAIVNFNLGLTRVLGVFGNMVPAKKINNLKDNGLANEFPTNSATYSTANGAAAIQQLFFLRGGEKFPIDYNINTLQRDDVTNTMADPQITRNFMNAIQQFSKIGRTSVNPLNTAITSGDSQVVNTKVDGGSSAGIGVAYDVISGNGVDFSSQNFGINMEVDLLSDHPIALYLFVHSKQTLSFSQNGIQITK